MLERCLEDLETRIDPEVEERLESEWEDFTAGHFNGAIFSPRRARRIPPRIAWPAVSVNRAQADPEAMLLQQYGACSERLSLDNGGLMMVRANYGTAILPSLFGVEMFVMDEALNTLQTCKPLGAAAMRELVLRDPPAATDGLGADVLDMGRRFVEIATRYPKIGRYVHLYHPDLQGPMDVCEMLWGSEMFLDLIDCPELAHRVLNRITETYLAFMRAWNAVVGDNGKDWAPHWGFMHGGKIMLRTDSGMNLSGEMYREFIRPYDQRLLDALGGGAVHYCGRGSHFIAGVCGMRGLHAVNLGQPHLNDMETIYRHTVDKGIKLLGLMPPHTQEALAAGRDLHGNVHCW